MVGHKSVRQESGRFGGIRNVAGGYAGVAFQKVRRQRTFVKNAQVVVVVSQRERKFVTAFYVRNWVRFDYAGDVVKSVRIRFVADEKNRSYVFAEICVIWVPQNCESGQKNGTVKENSENDDSF